MTRYKVLSILIVSAVIFCIIRAPAIFSTYTVDTEEPQPVGVTYTVDTEEPQPVGVFDYIEDIRRDCGQLCNTSRLGLPGPYFDHVKAPIDCPAIFKNEYIDRSHGLEHAPNKIPDALFKDFTMNGRMEVSSWYFDQQYLGKKAATPVWEKQKVDEWVNLARSGKLRGNYGSSETNALRDGLKNAPGVKDGRVLVIGSENPWVEACIIEAGAREVVTLEYGEIISKHPQIQTMTPSVFRKSFLDGTLGKFDAVVTFSSVEHSGLGRYGDALNPWGDIIAIARAWCVTKEGGSLTIGVMYDFEHDHIRFNAGRWYGKLRYPYLATNWRQHYRGKGAQRVYVFTNSEVGVSSEMQKYLIGPHPYRNLKDTNKKYSQVNQDQAVYDIFPKENGFFVEMGGYDGHTLSNTLWLERHHNWTGLLVEANPGLCKQIDGVQRRIWRLCACISDKSSVSFITGGTVGSAADTVDEHHIKQLNPKQTITVPCFKLDKVLNYINVTHIDYFSLDVEGAEMVVLNSMKNELISKKIVVDVWTIEYRVFDGKKDIFDASVKNLVKLRNFFREIGGYVEHSQLTEKNRKNTDGWALDVVFVNIETWCKVNQVLPDGNKC